jgi:hypothetical protein
MNPLSQTLNALVDNALEVDNASQPPREYLGASEIGDLCERKLAFKWHKHPAEPFKGRGIRRFRMGHIHEDETARWLKMAGFKLTGEQLGFSLADGKFSGHVDGFITDGPVGLLPYPVLFEHKIMKSNIWRALTKSNVETEHPKYFGQLQIYMRQFGLTAALFTALNTDTSELHFELVGYDPAKAEVYIDRAQRILSSESPQELPRIGRSEFDFLCKFCPYKAACWGDVVVRTREVPTPMWLKK